MRWIEKLVFNPSMEMLITCQCGQESTLKGRWPTLGRPTTLKKKCKGCKQPIKFVAEITVAEIKDASSSS